MQILRQSTAVDVLIGPFVDSTDGDTAETGLTLAAADILLSKNGQTLALKSDVTAAVHDAIGMYNCELDVTDTDTIGTLVLIVHEAGALHVRHEYQIIEEGVYDGLFASGASDIADILVDTGTTLDTKLDNMSGATFNTTTDSLEAIRNRGDSAWTGGATTTDSGTAQAGSASTITLQSGASAVDNTYNGQLIYISAGTGVGQSKAIANIAGSYVGSTKVATIIGTWATNPDATSVYEIYPADIDEINDPPTALAIADAVWDESTTGHTGAGTFGEQVKLDIDAILNDTGDMQPKIGIPSANLSADIAAIKAETALVVADTNELQTDWTDAGRLDAILGLIAADTADIQPKIGTPAADLAADIAAAKVDTAAILVDTDTTIPALIAALNDISTADVNAQVLDVLNVDTFSEPGQATPGVDTSIQLKIAYLYKAWRNRSTETATAYNLYNDDATTVDQKATVADDATTASRTEIITGP